MGACNGIFASFYFSPSLISPILSLVCVWAHTHACGVRVVVVVCVLCNVPSEQMWSVYVVEFLLPFIFLPSLIAFYHWCVIEDSLHHPGANGWAARCLRIWLRHCHHPLHKKPSSLHHLRCAPPTQLAQQTSNRSNTRTYSTSPSTCNRFSD
jgi:hypothetical protein